MSGTESATSNHGSGGGGGALDKFLTPEAMLTPGAAGGITMLIANTLAKNFGLPPSYIGLALSFLFGLLVMASARKWWIQGIYYVLNSLIIFCVAFGSGNLVAAKGERGHDGTSLSLVAPAYADEPVPSPLQTLRDDYAKLDAEYNKEVDALAALQKNGALQSEIDRQNAVIQDLQQKKAANLSLQATALQQLLNADHDITHGPGPNNAIAKTVPNQGILGGPNSFFRQWVSPFNF
ncbi:MAG: hypothetical protein P4L66_16015 [Acetobacteraceae bacterium]|nr:hypothetical protein [Acetobacteraceae bacterium]